MGTWRIGRGAPSNALGVNGDYYQNLDTNDVYLRSAGVYAIVANTGEPTLNATALCTVDEAKAYLRLNRVTGNQDTDLDVLLPIIINGVSDAIIQHTGREFFPSTGVTRTYEYTGGEYVNLYPHEYRTITSVSFDGGTLTAGTGIGDGDYLPYPRQQTLQGTYLYLKAREFIWTGGGNSLAPGILGERDITIVGDSGMASVPSQVKLAALEAVSLNYHDPEMVDTRGTGQFQIVNPTAQGGEMLFSDRILAMLDPFVRPLIG